MSNLDDSGRIPPPRVCSSSHTSSSSPRNIFPGFLSTDHEDAGPSGKITLSPEPAPALSYLRGSALPAKKGPPARLDLGRRSLSSASLETGGYAQGRLQTGGFERPLGSSGVRRRPSPLELGRARAVGLDEEPQEQRDLDGPHSALSVTSVASSDSLQGEMQDLSALRRSVRRNLSLRPMDSPLTNSDSGGSSRAMTPELLLRQDDIPVAHAVSISALVDLLSLPSTTVTSGELGQTVILDTRPLGDFLDAHLPRSANVSIPSLMFKRFSKSSSSKPTSWDSLGSFISTPAGKSLWAAVDQKERVNVVVIGLTAADETAKVLRAVVDGIVEGDVKLLRGGWAAVLQEPIAVELLVSGERSIKSLSSEHSICSTSLPSPGSVIASDVPPSTLPMSSSSRVLHHPSMPSLRTWGVSDCKRNIPMLSLHTGAKMSRRPPKLSLNLDKPIRSATTGPFGDGSPHTSNDLDVPGRRTNPGLTISGPRSPLHISTFQDPSERPRSPPSPGLCNDADDTFYYENCTSPSNFAAPSTPWSSDATARPDERSYRPLPPSPNPMVAGSTTARHGIAPFVVSTILPSFLYLGPEITSREEVDALVKLGVKRILNVAFECDDDDELRLKERFERYLKLPMRDMVEESGVAKGMRDSCKFLDDARLHSAPTYVHCKAGKSRSVTVVLAYLIHANAWTLKTSYAYVAERRKGISPNIGFVAELMQFEETELGLKQSGGVHGEGSGRSSASGGREEPDEDIERNAQKGEKRANPRHMRESLPPAWAASLDSGHVKRVPLHDEGDAGCAEEEGRRGVGDEREVRKNGQWVHHRRAPVDRTTLQPGRRVSKAGLESLRPLATVKGLSASTPRPSPRPSPGLLDGGDKPNTPGGEGRLGWV